ncbi:hypothetical protein U8L64_00290, partial [Pseudomonas sp. FIP_A4]
STPVAWTTATATATPSACRPTPSSWPWAPNPTIASPPSSTGRARPGLRAILEVAGRDHRRITSTDLGFILGPRLNAAGRLDDTRLRLAQAQFDARLERRQRRAQLEGGVGDEASLSFVTDNRTATPQPNAAPAPVEVARLCEGGQMFANRLQMNLRLLVKWAR